MISRRLLLACLGLIAPTAVLAAPSIEVEVDPAADFRGYHTYSWIPRGAPKGAKPEVMAQIREAIDRRLAAQGFVQGAPPDFMVTFTVGANDRLDDPSTDYSVVYTRTGPMLLGAQTTRRVIRDGSLTVHVFDAASRRPVWRAVASQEISPDGASAKIINKAVTGAMARFPPRP